MKLSRPLENSKDSSSPVSSIRVRKTGSPASGSLALKVATVPAVFSFQSTVCGPMMMAGSSSLVTVIDTVIVSSITVSAMPSMSLLSVTCTTTE